MLFAIRKDGFKEHPAVLEELDLVDESEQFTHMLTLDDDSIKTQLETQLNVFRFDPDFEKTEENYKQIKKGNFCNFLELDLGLHEILLFTTVQALFSLQFFSVKNSCEGVLYSFTLISIVWIVYEYVNAEVL